MGVKDWDTTMAVNLRAPMFCTQVAAKSMIARGVKGSIVNVSSQASLVALPEHAAYCTSKAGMDMLNKIPLGRFAEVEDVVQPILFLLSGACGMVTGSVMPIEGGFASTATLK